MASASASANGRAARFGVVDVLRAVAALWVVLYHAHRVLEVPPGRIPRPIEVAIFDAGHLGVAVFFAVSGYVIATSLRSTDVDGIGAVRFLARRIVRLAPPYYLSIVAVVAVALASTVVGNGEPFELNGGPVTFPQVVANLLFSHEFVGQPGLSVIYWSLCVEVAFYLAIVLIAGIATSLGRRGFDRRAVAGVAALAALGCALGPLPQEAPWRVLSLSAAFAAGVVVQWCGAVPRRRPVAVAYLAAVGAAGAVHANPFLPTAAVAALVLLCWGRAGRLPGPLRRLADGAGVSSYSLYLFHMPVLTVVDMVVERGLGSGHELLQIGVGVAASLVVARVAWWAVERSAITWGRRIGAAPSRRPAQRPAQRPARRPRRAREGGVDLALPAPDRPR